MSEHRRKLPQSSPPPGGRAAARRGGQPPEPPSSGGVPSGPEEPYQGRAAARRAAQGRGSRRRAGGGSGPGGSGAGGSGPGTPTGRGGRGPGRQQPAKKRFIDYPRFGKDGWRRWVPSWRQVTAIFIGGAASVIGLVGVAYALVAVPDVNQAATAQNNVYEWADGSQMIATGGEVNRQIIGIDEIPQSMQDAVISAENKTFETDAGVDPMGIGRALYNMAKGGETQGGSTITQQYVKNTRLNQEQTISRKFKELFISIKVGATMSKDQIMAGYLNTSYFGRGAFGIQAAARTYYGVDAIDLNPSQCAFLAALLKGPTYYDPAGATSIDPNATAANNLKNSTGRWTWILDQEVKYGHMSATERAKYTTYPSPDPVKKNTEMAGQIGYMVDLANQYMITNDIATSDELAKGGYQIKTTFQKSNVNALEAAVKKVQAANIKPGGTHVVDGEDMDKYVQFGGASINPTDGAIIAIYGGTDATTHFTNNANETGAQVGSTFKPFVLAAAMTDGVRDPKGTPDQPDSERTKVSPDSVFSGKDNQLIYDYTGAPWEGTDPKTGEKFQWHQPNDDGDNVAKVTLRTALDKSLNSPYVQLGQDVGTDKVSEAAIKAGLVANSNNGLLDYATSVTYSIGTSSPSAIRMADAYSTFDNNGEQNDPYSVVSVQQSGKQIYKHVDKPKVAFDPLVANTITGMLEDVVKKGTGTTAQLPDGRVAAGKTGTTDDNKSAWFDGYTPQLSTSIVMFRRDDQEHTDSSGKAVTNPFLPMYGTGGAEKIHGNSFPASIWKDYMSTVLKDEPKLTFPKPTGDTGEVIYGNVPSPTPSPTATTPPPTTTPATTSPPTTASASPSASTASPTPSDTGTCMPWDTGYPDCGGSSPSPSDTPSETPTATATTPGRGATGLGG